MAKEFLEAGKQRLDGNTKRQGNSEEVSEMRPENDQLKLLVGERALQHPEKSSRKLTWHFVDKMKCFISESSVSRILKGRDLVQSPAFEMISAKDKFEKPT